MENYFVSSVITLPSHGKVYEEEVKPTLTLRSMTTNEELRRLNPTERPNKVLADILDDCMVDNPGISAYDMCLGDFQFLLLKLRIVTYGTDYKIASICPYCNNENTGSIDLSQLSIREYSDSIEKYYEFDLPVSKKKIRLKMQTPRILDDIEVKNKDLKKRSSGASGDSAFLLNLESMIDTVDGEHLSVVNKPQFIRGLHMMDTNTILAYAAKLNDFIGIDAGLSIKCESCGLDYDSRFRTTSEFFRPSLDI